MVEVKNRFALSVAVASGRGSLLSSTFGLAFPARAYHSSPKLGAIVFEKPLIIVKVIDAILIWLV
jgi:hypothetical protein